MKASGPGAGLDAHGLPRILHQGDGTGRQLAHGAHDLRMAGMADHQDVALVRPAIGEVALRLAVDLADQGAGGVVVVQVAALGLLRHGFRHAVGGEHDVGIGRHLVQFLHEDRALGLQRLDHGAVVDDLVPHVHRGAEPSDGLFDHANRAVDAGTKAARAG